MYAASQIAGGSVNFVANFNNASTFGFGVWIDWNNDNDFYDAGEQLYSSGAYLTNATGTFMVPAAALPGNYRMRVRADALSTAPLPCGTILYGETEDYTFTVVTPPPCSGIPSTLIATITGSGTATLSWTAASPAPASGYQYYYSTSPIAPTAGTTPLGSTAAGVVSANISGLSLGVTYYVWVRSNCGGATGQGLWTGPVSLLIPSCGIGNSLGTTTLACPSVISGGLGLSGNDPVPIDCTTSGCVDLEATYLQLGQTTSYTVESILYEPPYQFGCLKNAVSVDDDDVWSPVINLPFNFCFYGNTYNSCLISSNGVVSFDQVNNTAGGSSAWSFNTNLPNTSLFRNSIFGVYHDIDPSIGGEVGWELITLNTGCRALVASWKDIPMYSTTCNSQLYTGMIVLYENTNIIDVYIQQKTVCASWNNGNAIVGIQNAAGNTATVAPNRNGLSPDWAVTNEAWRFRPSGTPITSITWFQGSGTSGPVVGNTDTITVCPTATTTYTARVTYALCNGATLTEVDETTVNVDNGKIWNGSVSSNWNTAANWTPTGVPTAAQCVRVPNVANPCIISGSGFNAYAYSVRVENGGILNLQSNNNLTITNEVNVITGGTFNIYDSANLLQVNNSANSGIANLQRITRPMYRYDYTYWNSPMTLASNFTLGSLSPLTLSDKYYSWQPFVGGGTGTWQQESAATVMNPAKGYIVRAPQTYSTNPSTTTAYTGTFIGTPNNGPMTAPVAHGTMGALTTFDKWNLIGNPYPSGLSAASLLMYPQNVTAIDGTIYLWTHNSPPSTAYPDPFYNDFVINYTDADYASWNLLGPVSTIASTGGPAPTGTIASGQSFFVRSLLPTGNVQFNNSMRTGTGNNAFFRTSAINEDELEQPIGTVKHRIWLNMNGENNSFCQTLVGYANGATLGYDRALDGRKNEGASLSFYSLIPDDKLVIQGRPLPFDIEDQVPLGVNCPVGGTYSIGIDRFDPFFDQITIYIEDKWANVIHDIKQSAYTFTLENGRVDDRFVLRYTQNSLALHQSLEDQSIIYVSNQHLYFQSNSEVENIRLYDMTGKLLHTLLPISDSFHQSWDFPFAQATYMAAVTMKNGDSFGRKLLNRQ
ncbi:GEVED domain-containing protein [Flavobacterium silvaticum]